MLLSFKSFIIAMLKENNTSVNKTSGLFNTTPQNFHKHLNVLSKRIDEADAILNKFGYTITFEKLK